MADKADIQHRQELRETLIQTLTESAGDREHAEYVVNNLTAHRPELLAKAAVTFARPHVERWLAP